MHHSPNKPEDFRFACPFDKMWLIPREAGQVLGRGESYVIGLIEEGKLEAHAPLDRKKKRYTISLRSVLLHLVETATYEPEQFEQRLRSLLQSLTPAQLDNTARMIAAIQKPARKEEVR